MYKPINKTKNILASIFTEPLFIRLFSAWCIVASIMILSVKTGFDTIEFVSKINVLYFCFMILCTILTLTLLNKAFNLPIDAMALAASTFTYGGLLVAKNRNFYFSLGVVFTLVLVFIYLLRDDKLHLAKIKLSDKTTFSIVMVCALFFVLYVGELTTLRYLNYTTSTYDFGIFAQMFHHMKTTFLPNTTCERNVLLSHFAIHISPMFYALLPGYYLFSSPIYLQIMQAVVLASAIIPLFLLGHCYGLSNKVLACVCVAFCFYPALAGGCFYDIHENMFLTPLLLWLLYFMDKQKWTLMYVFALLTCMVKEDAALYVACIALFLFFVRKKRLHGLIMFVGPLLYFKLALMLLKSMGQGAMTGRFDNIISDSSLGLLSAVKTILLNPAYLLCQIGNEKKLTYIVLMMLPILLLPLINKKMSQLLLVIPFFVINLISNYPYQHSINFQYNFGTIALFFYLVVINITELKARYKKYAAVLMVIASVMLFISNVGSNCKNINTYFKYRTENEQLNTYLEAIPEDASVQASGYFVPKLSGRLVLYDVRYNNSKETPYETEYVVLDLRPKKEKDSKKYLKQYEASGYKREAYQEDLIVVLKK